MEAKIEVSCSNCFQRKSGNCTQLKDEPCADFRAAIPITDADREAWRLAQYNWRDNSYEPDVFDHGHL